MQTLCARTKYISYKQRWKFEIDNEVKKEKKEKKKNCSLYKFGANFLDTLQKS